MKSINVKNLADLPRAASELIATFGDHTIIALHGGMGAGKTTLIKEVAAQMGVADGVTSPTFAIVNEYNTIDERKIYHFDFYRIDKVEEAYDFGYEEYFFSGDLCFVEWPEKIAELMPEDTLHVTIDLTKDNNERVITIESQRD